MHSKHMNKLKSPFRRLCRREKAFKLNGRETIEARLGVGK